MRRELKHNHGISPCFLKGKSYAHKCGVKAQQKQVFPHQQGNSTKVPSASRRRSQISAREYQICRLIVGLSPHQRIDNSSSSRTDAKDHAHRYARESLASSFWLSRGDGYDSQNSAVAYGVSTWVQYLRCERRLPAKSSREIKRSSKFSRLLANRLSGSPDSRKEYQKTSQRRQFITLRARRNAPVTTGAKDRLTLHRAPSSSFYTRASVGSSSNILCADAKSLGGLRPSAQGAVRRPTNTSASNSPLISDSRSAA